MRKQEEMTENIKSIIRDKLAWRPLLSVQQLQGELFKLGYRSANGGFLDWHYISKLAKKVRIENIEKLKSENRSERLSRLKERLRVVTDTLADVIEGHVMLDGIKEARYPTPTERIMAANTLLKWETAMFFAEEAVNHLSSNNHNHMEKPELMTFRKPESKTKKWARMIPKILSADES
jgi:hypothetical protein